MKFYKTFTILLIILSFFSCNDEMINIETSKEANKLTPLEYYKILRIKPDGGRIMLESNNSTSFNNKYRYNNIVCTNTKREILDFELIDKKANTKIIINNKDSNKLETIFGKTIKYKINDLQKKGENSTEVYVPELLSVSINTVNLEPGTIVTWNVDPLNTNGLILWYEYSPLVQDKYSVVNNNREVKQGALTIPDVNGTYIVKDSDLAFIPNDARVTFNITRAGFNVSQGTIENQTAFIGATTVSENMRVKK